MTGFNVFFEEWTTATFFFHFMISVANQEHEKRDKPNKERQLCSGVVISLLIKLKKKDDYKYSFPMERLGRNKFVTNVRSLRKSSAIVFVF